MVQYLSGRPTWHGPVPSRCPAADRAGVDEPKEMGCVPPLAADAGQDLRAVMAEATQVVKGVGQMAEAAAGARYKTCVKTSSQQSNGTYLSSCHLCVAYIITCVDPAHPLYRKVYSGYYVALGTPTEVGELLPRTSVAARFTGTMRSRRPRRRFALMLCTCPPSQAELLVLRRFALWRMRRSGIFAPAGAP